MAATFTLPEELFNSMINGFNSNDKTDKKLLHIDSNKESKVDDKGVKTNLLSNQNKRIANIANEFFSLTEVKKSFEKNFVKFIDNVQEQEVTEAVKVIKKEAEEEAEEEKEKKKKKKKRSARATMRKYRMIMRFYTFAMKVYDNFKKFQRRAHEIIDRFSGGDNVTLKEAMTDEAKRKIFIQQKSKMFKELIVAFFDDVIMGSVIPLIELIIKMIVDALLEFFKKFHDIIVEIKEKVGDKALDFLSSRTGIKLTKKAFTKLASSSLGKSAGKLLAKVVAKQAALHAVAAGLAATGVGAIAAGVLEVGLWLWTAYDVASAVYDTYEAYQTGKRIWHEGGKRIISGLEKSIEKIDELHEKSKDIISNGFQTQSVISMIKNKRANTKRSKIKTFNDVYHELEQNREEAIKKFLDNKSNYSAFSQNTINYMKQNGMNMEQYVPYTVYGMTWMNFFNTFVENMKNMMVGMQNAAKFDSNFNLPQIDSKLPGSELNADENNLDNNQEENNLNQPFNDRINIEKINKVKNKLGASPLIPQANNFNGFNDIKPIPLAPPLNGLNTSNYNESNMELNDNGEIKPPPPKFDKSINPNTARYLLETNGFNHSNKKAAPLAPHVNGPEGFNDFVDSVKKEMQPVNNTYNFNYQNQTTINNIAPLSEIKSTNNLKNESENKTPANIEENQPILDSIALPSSSNNFNQEVNSIIKPSGSFNYIKHIKHEETVASVIDLKSENFERPEIKIEEVYSQKDEDSRYNDFLANLENKSIENKDLQKDKTSTLKDIKYICAKYLKERKGLNYA